MRKTLDNFNKKQESRKQIYFLLILCVCFTFSKAQNVFPYLQSCTPTSIYITWKTSSQSESLVQYGLTAGNLNTSTNGTNLILTDTGYTNNYYYHSVILRGLVPNTKYFYKVKSGSFTSSVCEFKTLPLPGKASTPDGHIRFLVMGDNQIKAEPRFDSLQVQALRKCGELYAGSVTDNISAIFNVGDQVDVGTLDHYENVHFAKSRYLSPYVPIQTTVGNHELYGTLQMNAYYDHFFYDSLAYKNVYSGSENYYAYQAGNVLFISLTTEHNNQNAAQMTWLQQVITAADNDATVDWIVSMGHRPYQAEQYVGDISTWIRNTVVPYLIKSPKYVLHIGAHHHLYARGQLKENPVYNIISGGTAWDQYWGMAQQQDVEDVQKTISNWIYNIIDVDVVNGKFNVDGYSIGSIYKYKNNQLMDQFYRYKNKAAPITPSITNKFPTSVTLPYTVTSSTYSSPSGELLNSTEFQFAQTPSFSTVEKYFYRDYEDLFGQAGPTPDSSLDVNAGVNILNVTLPVNSLSNGTHYVRVRHRDRNMEWSAWSAIDSLNIINSVVLNPELITDKTSYLFSDTIKATYSNGPGLSTDWVGIYKKGETPGNVSSTKWAYVNGKSGVLAFTNLPSAGEYFAAFFTNDGYTEIAPRVNFYVGPIPAVSTNQVHYNLGQPVTVNFMTAPSLPGDFLGIYRVGNTPGGTPAIQSDTVSGVNGSKVFTNLPKGYYFANYFLSDLLEPGQRVFFSVGDTITNLMLDKTVYNIGEYITATWTNSPGIVKDWLGFYRKGDNPNVQPLVAYTYFGGAANGTKVISNDTARPQVPGPYFIVMFTNDSYTEVSNRVYFTLLDTAVTSVPNNQETSGEIKIYPNPMSNNGNSVIESTYPIDKLEILDGLGRTVFISENIHVRSFSLVNMDIPAGVYYVRVHQDNRKSSVYKLIVNKQ